jgi:hypothetical protein
VLFVALPACSGQPGFYVENEGLPVGCAPNGPAKYFRVLGRFCFETFLRLACLKWLLQTLCSYARYLGVSTLHTFKINTISPASSLFVSTTTEDLFTLSTFQDVFTLSLFEVGTLTRPRRGLPYQPPCSYARRTGCLYTLF